ncbi:MAG: efflux RND transporter periplasmic adaptor subunit [Candidatus Kaiserbacteria bacterium]|nr:efflux RND transporter periplasmic adaptor subunit [Candidatus Kaiserbacteria bacterium]
MGSFLKSEILLHPVVLTAFAIVVVICGGSLAYFELGARAPQQDASITLVASTMATSSNTAVTATGVVSPSVNPDLSFQAGGRIVSISVHVGSHVGRGTVLASLDTAALSAARDQAAANLRAQQARLADMQAGPRSVDITQKQTAVDQAQQVLSDKYVSSQNDVAAGYSSSLGSLHANIDTLYFGGNGATPMLTFLTSDTNLTNRAQDGRASAGLELSTWGSEVSNAASDSASVEASLSKATAHATALRAYADLLTQTLGVALTNSNTFTASQLATAQANLATFRASVQSTISTLEADLQAIATDKLAIRSAQDALAQAQTGSTQQQLDAQSAMIDAAQANLEAANAALQNAIIVAPYAGTVTAVPAKVGDTIAPNTVAISLTPHSSLELDAYLSEVDAARVSAGDAASVTLDAFGTSRAFAATVVSVDRSPTMQAGVPAHKVVVQFSDESDDLAPGMTGNVTITPAR